MFYHNNALTSSHPYSSQPISWPFLLRGVSFWTKGDDLRQQIYFIGNPVGWWLAVGFLAVFTGIVAADQVTRRRGIESIEERNSPPPSPFIPFPMLSASQHITSHPPEFFVGNPLTCLCSRPLPLIQFNRLLLPSLGSTLLPLLPHGPSTLPTPLPPRPPSLLPRHRRANPIPLLARFRRPCIPRRSHPRHPHWSPCKPAWNVRWARC
jgi:hypothetical protein